MLTVLDPAIEKCRVAGPPNSGPIGQFRIFCPVLYRTLSVQCNDDREWAELGLPFPAWEHVSVSASTIPTWLEMCWIKDQFWHPEECVIQFHPPKSVYVNDHERTLHLWRPVGVSIPMPPKECV